MQEGNKILSLEFLFTLLVVEGMVDIQISCSPVGLGNNGHFCSPVGSTRVIEEAGLGMITGE